MGQAGANDHTTPIARGRAADVYAFGDGLVLRRYRTPYDGLHEGAVMQYVRAQGYPVPEVVEVAGGDMVMERVNGPTMLADFSRRPWRMRRYAHTLAELLHRLHAIPAPSWLQSRHDGGKAIVHLDLHPDNVIITSSGPMVIDWTNAGRGIPEAEIADLWLILANANIPGNRVVASVLQAGRGLFLRTLMARFDRDAVRRQLRFALERRLRDMNILEVERARMRKFVDRFAL